MNFASLPSTRVTTGSDQTVPLSDLLTQPLNVFHLQDSCGSGRTCRIVLSSIEDSLFDMTKLASVRILFADDAFDKQSPLDSPVQRVGISKEALREMGALDEEGYVQRVTVILDKTGNVLRVLPVTTEDELTTHILLTVLPELKKLGYQA